MIQIALELEQFALEIFRGHEYVVKKEKRKVKNLPNYIDAYFRFKESVMAFYTGKFKYNSSVNLDDSIQVPPTFIFYFMFYFLLLSLYLM
jgi:hypothetical protein